MVLPRPSAASRWVLKICFTLGLALLLVITPGRAQSVAELDATLNRLQASGEMIVDNRMREGETVARYFLGAAGALRAINVQVDWIEEELSRSIDIAAVDQALADLNRLYSLGVRLRQSLRQVARHLLNAPRAPPALGDDDAEGTYRDAINTSLGPLRLATQELGGRFEELGKTVENARVRAEQVAALLEEAYSLHNIASDRRTPAERRLNAVYRLQELADRLSVLLEGTRGTNAHTVRSQLEHAAAQLLQELVGESGGEVEAMPGTNLSARTGSDRAEIATPPLNRPWQLPDALQPLPGADPARDQRKLQNSIDLLSRPTEWAERHLSALPRSETDWNIYFHENLTRLFANYRNRDLVGRDREFIRRVLDGHDRDFIKLVSDAFTGEELDRSSTRRRLEAISAQLDPTRQLNWRWILAIASDGGADVQALRDSYDRLQDELRSHLLIRRDRWTADQAGAYQARLENICRQIVDVERIAVWMLGSPRTNNEWNTYKAKIDEAVLLKMRQGTQQASTFEAWLRTRLLDAFFRSFGSVFLPQGPELGFAAKMAADHANEASDVNRRAHEQNEAAQRDLRDKVLEAWQWRMQRGLEQAGSTFLPRELVDTAQGVGGFYAGIIDASDSGSVAELYGRGLFRHCASFQQTSSEFLDPAERRQFLEQQNHRRRAMR